MKKTTLTASLTVLLITVPAVAQQVQRTLSLTLNGTPSSEKALVINGKTYIPASELRKLGISVTATKTTVTLTQSQSGGANGQEGTAGCSNQTLFNGLWRFTLTSDLKQESEYGDPVWVLEAEVRNASKQSSRLDFSGLQGVGFVYADGRVLSGEARDFSVDIPAGAASRGRFVSSRTSNPQDLKEKPVKLLLVWDENVRKNANVRFDLTCKK